MKFELAGNAVEMRRDQPGALCCIPEKKDETQMKLTGIEWFGAGRRMGLGLCLTWMALGVVANAQAVSTTTVQGTVYLATGHAGSGTLVVSWPAFTTANGHAVAADSTTVTIAADGFVSVNLVPNLGATPAGLFYKAVYYMSDGSTSTEYWVVPSAAQAALSQVRAQVMPAAQAGTGAVTLQPMISGAPAGTSYAINPANQYTLRVRAHCPEHERTLNIYRSFGDSGAIACGGQSILSPGKLQLEIQEFVNGVGGTPVTLYDGAIVNLPGACMVAAASSINLIGTMRAIHLTNLGSGWVVSTPPDGGPYTRRVGTTSEAAECHLERIGKLVFYTGFAPVDGEQIAVNYRTVGRAVAER